MATRDLHVWVPTTRDSVRLAQLNELLRKIQETGVGVSVKTSGRGDDLSALLWINEEDHSVRTKLYRGWEEVVQFLRSIQDGTFNPLPAVGL